MGPYQDIKDVIPDSSRRTADQAAQWILKDRVLFDRMLQLALKEEGVHSMRAARVVSLASASNPEWVAEHVDKIVRRLPEIRHAGVKRGLLKTLLERPFDYGEETIGYLVHACFQFFNDPKEEVAIKAYALDLLYQTTLIYPELKGELVASIDLAQPQFSTGMKTRSRIIRKLLMEG